MIFQTLDDKSTCVGVYADGSLFFDDDWKDLPLSKTWKPTTYLREKDIEYASLYLEGRPVTEVIPEYLEDDWKDVTQRLGAFKRCLEISQISRSENCFYDLVPSRFLMEYCEIKNQITDHVISSLSRPSRYEFYKEVCFLLEEIAQRNITLDNRVFQSYINSGSLGRYAESVMSASPVVKYNQFGTKTGRLTTTKGCVPILTLPKPLRRGILPTNDFFVEIDFNGAEIRTLLGILGKEQPSGDVHSFHQHHLMERCESRDKAKVAFFAWLYGSRTAVSKDDARRFEDYYQRQELLDRFWDGRQVVTPYQKIIAAPSEHVALNYLVQSTAAELLLKQALKVNYLLRTSSSGSFLSFLIHDSIILDMKKEDMGLLGAAQHLMSSTNYGKYEINLSKGATLGTLEKWKI